MRGRPHSCTVSLPVDVLLYSTGFGGCVPDFAAIYSIIPLPPRTVFHTRTSSTAGTLSACLSVSMYTSHTRFVTL